MRVPWTIRTSNPSILKEINPDYSLEGLMLRLKHQYFGHLTLGKNEGRRRGRQRMRWLDGITISMEKSLIKLRDGDGQGILACYSPWGREESDKTEQLNNNNKADIFTYLLSYL